MSCECFYILECIERPLPDAGHGEGDVHVLGVLVPGLLLEVVFVPFLLVDDLVRPLVESDGVILLLHRHARYQHILQTDHRRLGLLCHLLLYKKK